MVLLPAVVQAVSVPVVGAGGYCDGASLAAAASRTTLKRCLANWWPRK